MASAIWDAHEDNDTPDGRNYLEVSDGIIVARECHVKKVVKNLGLENCMVEGKKK